MFFSAILPRRLFMTRLLQ